MLQMFGREYGKTSKEKFNKIDANRSGSITADEVMAERSRRISEVLDRAPTKIPVVKAPIKPETVSIKPLMSTEDFIRLRTLEAENKKLKSSIWLNKSYNDVNTDLQEEFKALQNEKNNLRAQIEKQFNDYKEKTNELSESNQELQRSLAEKERECFDIRKDLGEKLDRLAAEKDLEMKKLEKNVAELDKINNLSANKIRSMEEEISSLRNNSDILSKNNSELKDKSDRIYQNFCDYKTQSDKERTELQSEN